MLSACLLLFGSLRWQQTAGAATLLMHCGRQSSTWPVCCHPRATSVELTVDIKPISLPRRPLLHTALLAAAASQQPSVIHSRAIDVLIVGLSLTPRQRSIIFLLSSKGGQFSVVQYKRRDRDTRIIVSRCQRRPACFLHVC